MEDARAIFGKTISCKGTQAAQLLELAIGEVFLAPKGGREMLNLFGRTAAHVSSQDLAGLRGSLFSGIRGGALLSNKQAMGNLAELQRLVRSQLPGLVYLDDPAEDLYSIYDRHLGYHHASGTGCFQLYASNCQELLDFALIAHKVSELTLIPGVLGIDIEHSELASRLMHLPDVKDVRRFLGSCDDQIECPTPAQRMIFGEQRRRVPNWFDVDLPLGLDLPKDSKSLELETAARQQYFGGHISGILDDIRMEYAEITGRRYQALQTYRVEDANHLVVLQGSLFWSMIKAVDQLRTTRKEKVGCVHLNQLRPFPERQLGELIQSKKSVTVVDVAVPACSQNGPLYREVLSASAGLSRLPTFHQAFCLMEPTLEEAITIFDNVLVNAEPRRMFFTGLAFTRRSLDHPQQQILSQRIERDYPNVKQLSLTPYSPQAPSEKTSELSEEIPAQLEALADEGPPFFRLSRFYRDTIFGYKLGNHNQVIADPFQALPVAPIFSERFQSGAETREQIPRFIPELCTGCAHCQLYCPVSAIPALVCSVEDILRGGQKMAVEQGMPVTKLTPYIKALTTESEEVLRARTAVSTVSDFLQDAFDRMIEVTGLQAERLTQIRTEFENLSQIIGGMQVSLTDFFFPKDEVLLNPSSDLFALAIDPLVCTGCGICAQLCPADALVMEGEDGRWKDESQHQLKLVKKIPPTDSDIIAKKIEDQWYNSWSAQMLDHTIYNSMASTSSDPEHHAGQISLHAITAMIKAQHRPRIEKWNHRIIELAESLSQQIDQEISSAIPKDNATLLKMIDRSVGERLPLNELFSRMESSEHFRLVDTSSLQRKLELLDDLEQLSWLLTKGPTGAGRAPYAIIYQRREGRTWPQGYPWNPFGAPVILSDSLHSADQMKMAVQGMLRHFMDNVKLVRRAEMESSGIYRPEIHVKDIAGLTWEALTEEEKSCAPLLLIVFEHQDIYRLEQDGIQMLLQTNWPVKLLILDDCTPRPDENGLPFMHHTLPLFSSVLASRRNSYVKGSIHQSSSYLPAREALSTNGPAVLHMAIPSPDATGLLSYPEVLDLAVKTRAFPQLVLTPDQKNVLLASGLDLECNPDPEKRWFTETLGWTNGASQEQTEYTWTYADWLSNQQDWKDEFRPVNEEEEANQLPVSEYLAFDAKSQSNYTPIIFKVNGQSPLQVLAVSDRVIEWTRLCLERWNLLRELAGYLSDQPTKLWEKAQETFARDLETAKAKMQEDFDLREKAFEKRFIEQVRNKVRDKLMSMSKAGKNNLTNS